MKLSKETNYAFRNRMNVMHKKNLRDYSVIKPENSIEIFDDFKIFIPSKADEVVLTAAKDFEDFLCVSMGISSVIKKYEKMPDNTQNSMIIAYAGDADKKLTVGNGYMGYRIETSDCISVYGFDSRGIAQAFYYIESELKLIKAPFFSKKPVEKKALFSPRMVHSGYGQDLFPDDHICAIAHAGMDAILVYVKGTNITSHGLLDFNNLIERAYKYGVDVYCYVTMSSFVYPEGEEGEKFYDGLYGKLMRACPRLKGLVFVGESVEFPSRDKNTTGKRYFVKPDDNIPTGKVSPGWWPCYDYPLWINMVKNCVRKVNPDADFVFWSYNWGWTPEKDRIALINSLPTDISLLVTFEMFEQFDIGGGVVETCVDYTLSFEGPGKYFSSEAKAAKERGIRLYAMANTGGLTWDFGVIPYEPMPHQWMKRYNALKKAHKDWGLCGIMESHHFGFYPSFISELCKNAYFDGSVSDEEYLKKLVARDCGAENTGRVVDALKLWSEAINTYISTNEDQYGPFRIGPAYPLCLNHPMAPPDNPYAMYGGTKIYNPLYKDTGGHRNTPFSIRIHSEISHCKKMESLMLDGINLMKSCENVEKHEEFLYLINLGEFILRCIRTTINVKNWYVAKCRLYSEATKEGVTAAIETLKEIGYKEIENAKEAIEFVSVDSRLGWEPSMEYMADEEHILWKIKQVNYVLDVELKRYVDAININL